MPSKRLIVNLSIVILVALVGAGIYVVSTRQVVPSTPTRSPSPVPTLTPTWKQKVEKTTRKVGEKEGSFLIRKINPSSVTGLWWGLEPVARVDDPGTPRTLHIGDDIGFACAGVSDKLTQIDFSDQSVTFIKVVSPPPPGGCPICLAGNTLIETPVRLVPAKDFQAGMSVWTRDKTGHRVSGLVTKTSRVQVPPTHQMVHLVLGDGRELFASPGHPTMNGRTIGDLAPGDVYNGGSVAGTQRVPYSESATYDILPSGDTGLYWANGILVGSSLR